MTSRICQENISTLVLVSLVGAFQAVCPSSFFAILKNLHFDGEISIIAICDISTEPFPLLCNMVYCLYWISLETLECEIPHEEEIYC